MTVFFIKKIKQIYFFNKYFKQFVATFSEQLQFFLAVIEYIISVSNSNSNSYLIELSRNN